MLKHQISAVNRCQQELNHFRILDVLFMLHFQVISSIPLFSNFIFPIHIVLYFIQSFILFYIFTHQLIAQVYFQYSQISVNLHFQYYFTSNRFHKTMTHKVISILIVLLYLATSQQFSNASAKAFADAFNLPPPLPASSSSFSSSSSLSSNVLQSNISPSFSSTSPSLRTAAQFGYSSAGVTADQTSSKLLLKDSVQRSKTVVGQQDNRIYIIMEQDSSLVRREIKTKGLLQRLYNNRRNFLKVSRSWLSQTKQGKALDKYAQLVKAKGQPQIYLVHESFKHLVSSEQMINFGFSRQNILQIEPCFIQTFLEGDQLK